MRVRKALLAIDIVFILFTTIGIERVIDALIRGFPKGVRRLLHLCVGDELRVPRYSLRAAS